jgi:hypothetical protein
LEKVGVVCVIASACGSLLELNFEAGPAQEFAFPFDAPVEELGLFFSGKGPSELRRGQIAEYMEAWEGPV